MKAASVAAKLINMVLFMRLFGYRTVTLSRFIRIR
jgi:hypothetical protein